ncbi:MAG: phosphatase PAP2 family protein [Alphaproteobacteria bacterium]|nr:phosphatase PAP2 family protein [Alphaproteobacteria bacterium]
MNRLLPHEIVFGCFLIVTAVRLLVAAGPANTQTLLYFCAILLNVGAVGFCLRWPRTSTWRLRFVFYIVALNVIFIDMRWSIPLISAAKHDVALWSWDMRWLGGSPSIWLEPLVTPWLTETMSLAYGAFIPYLLLTLILYAWGDLVPARAFYSGLFTIYGIGYLGYTLLPAIGPYVAMADHFVVPLHGYWISDLLTALYPIGTNRCDAFPSLHVAASAYILAVDFRYRRLWYYGYLVPCGLLWLSTVYLRYHYGVDVLAGVVLAAVGLAVAAHVRQCDDVAGPVERSGS